MTRKSRPRVDPKQETKMFTLRIGEDVYAMLRAHTTAEEQRDILYRLAKKNYNKFKNCAGISGGERR